MLKKKGTNYIMSTAIVSDYYVRMLFSYERRMYPYEFANYSKVFGNRDGT